MRSRAMQGKTSTVARHAGLPAASAKALKPLLPGNQALLGVPPKLRISRPGDAAEREAERVADAVMSSRPATPIAVSQSEGIQRACAKCEEEKDSATVQRQALRGGAATPATGFAMPGSMGSGAALGRTTLDFFEPSFGYRFENVRVHDGPMAAASAAAVQAKAYTIGNDIVFGANEYQPGTVEGRHLLAHELAHVVQQNTGMEPMIHRLAEPDCDRASGLPMTDSCGSFGGTCYSRSFTASKGASVSVSVTVNYAEEDCSFPEGREDFRVIVRQCGWMDTDVADLGVANIGSTLRDTVTIPGAGIIAGNDNYYVKVRSRSRCRLDASISVR